jgi:hypothetical protein
MKAICIGVAALLLSGCAAQLPRDVTDAAMAPMYCRGKVQCDRAWQAAQAYIAMHGEYRLQTTTDTVIQTYGPMPNQVQLAYMAIKEPIGPEDAQIKVTARCANLFGCTKPPMQAMADFKQYVRTSAGL